MKVNYGVENRGRRILVRKWKEGSESIEKLLKKKIRNGGIIALKEEPSNAIEEVLGDCFTRPKNRAVPFFFNPLIKKRREEKKSFVYNDCSLYTKLNNFSFYNCASFVID